MTCDKIISLPQLFNMALRPDDSGNLIIDTVETDVVDGCTPFDNCGDPFVPFSTLLVRLFQQRNINCFAIRVNIRSISDCSLLICDDDQTWEQAARRSITKGVDGEPVLNIADIGNLTKFECDDYQAALKSLFWSDGTCFAVRGGAGGAFNACSTFDCDKLPGWRMALQRAIGLASENCPAFFLSSSGVTPIDACGLGKIEMVISTCQIGSNYLWLLSYDGNPITIGSGFTIQYFYHDSNGVWIEITVHPEDSRSEEIPIADSYKAIVTCESDGREFVIVRTGPGSTYFKKYIGYRIDSGPIIQTDIATVIYLIEGEILTVSSADMEAICDWFLLAPFRTLALNAYNASVDYGDAVINDTGDFDIVFNVDIKDTTHDGCKAQASFTVNYIPLPVISGANSICDTMALLTAHYGPDLIKAYTTYQWKLNGVNIAGATGSTYNAVAPGNYTVVGTKSGRTVTSLVHAIVSDPIAIPELSFGFTDSDWYFDDVTDTYYVRSNNPGFFLKLNNANDYDPNNTIEIIDLLQPAVPIDSINPDELTFINFDNEIVVRVYNQDGCYSEASIAVNFSTLQAEQICANESTTTLCEGVEPQSPTDGKCGWMISNNRCESDGECDWVRDRGVCYDDDCYYYSPDTLAFNVVDNSDGTWTISTTGISNCDALDLTASPIWSVLLGDGNIVSNSGLSIVVDAPGVYGYVGGDCNCPLGVGNELREDGSIENREDNGIELREAGPCIIFGTFVIFVK